MTQTSSPKTAKKSKKSPKPKKVELTFLDIYQEDGSFKDPNSVVSNQVKLLVQMFGANMAGACLTQRKQISNSIGSEAPDTPKIIQGYAMGFYLGVNYTLRLLAKADKAAKKKTKK